MAFSFSVEKKIILPSGEPALGRAGILTTPHGTIETPAFVVVGTKATVKSLNADQVQEAGAQVVLANTYHLFLQPGDEIVARAGGLGKFMHWHGPTMTDSGGFQVFSLGAAYGKNISKIVKITDPSYLIPERFDDSDAPRLATIDRDGVTFKSHLDGSMHYITPEKSIQIQHNLGADMIFAFDECTSPSEDDRYQSDALMRTHAWAKRCLVEHHSLLAKAPMILPEVFPTTHVSENTAHKKTPQNTAAARPCALFGIVQGGRNEMLRKESAKIISEMTAVVLDEQGVEQTYAFDGFGIGGSFAKEDMSTAVKWVNEILPEDKPRHLLGIGEPEDLFMGIENGVDLFDCVLPTRLGRNGTIYTKHGKISITNAQFRNDFSPVDDECNCYTCQGYTKSYIAHMFHGKEMLGGTLASIHNVHFIVTLVKKIRQSILDNTFTEFKESFLNTYGK